MEWFFAFATWFDVLAISACIGTLVCAARVVPRHAPDSLNRSLWSGFGASVALLTVASGVLLVSRTMEFSGASFASLATYLPLVIGRTHYGLVWRWRMGAMGLLWLSWAAGRRDSRSLGAELLAGVALLVVVYSRSATGHAGDHGSFAVGVWVDMLHVLGSAVWVGTLFAMSLVVFPRLLRLEQGRDSAGAEIFGRLSTVAGVALVLIVVTGIYNAWKGLGNFNALWHSRYGHVLAFKLVLVAWMVFLGAHNRYIKLPALHDRAGNGGRGTAQADLLDGCARAVHAESALGACVLIAAAVLHHAMPPADIPTHPVDGASQFSPALVPCHGSQRHCACHPVPWWTVGPQEGNPLPVLLLGIGSHSRRGESGLETSVREAADTRDAGCLVTSSVIERPRWPLPAADGRGKACPKSGIGVELAGSFQPLKYSSASSSRRFHQAPFRTLVRATNGAFASTLPSRDRVMVP